MKLKFDPSLQYQQDAVDAVVQVFDGQPIAQSSFELSHTTGSLGIVQSELGVGNRLVLPDDKLLANVQAIQEKNDIEKVSALQGGREFSVEMETGTGKTYVYLRTIFELNKNFGFTKFIIVVPSVAIREGVLKSIKVTRSHFETLYNNVRFNAFVYDSSRLPDVRQFATANQIQIMVINIQAFIKDDNIINQERDGMSGHKPIEFIQAANPFVIIDEPQSVDNTDRAKKAVANLNPVATLRYSATHRNPYNLLYRLDPVKAYDLRLVKRIEVASVRSDDNFNDAYVKLLQTDNKKGIKAQVEIHQLDSKGQPKTSKLWVKQDDDLYDKSGKRDIYRQGYVVRNIDCTPSMEYVEFNQGRILELGQEIGGMTDDVMKAQIFETVEQHLKKERTLRGRGIKVLSLFFIDKVSNYRIYNEDGSTSLGKLGTWFEEAFAKCSQFPLFKDLETCKLPVDKIHNGYFSLDKKGNWKDSTERGSKDDDDTYGLIMREKERLLDQSEPLRFIFSHSALREGWDNPNVFQICTLNESQSGDKKRQEIGRGLRLPVNADGDRVHDEEVNRLTIVANESYEQFARALQDEFEEDYGIKFGRIEKIAFAKLVDPVKPEEGRIGQERSTLIWTNLKNEGYIDSKGDIQDKFDPSDSKFELKLSDEFKSLSSLIIDEMKKKVFKNSVVNARDRQVVRFNKQIQLSEDFELLWNKIKQRTRYRVSFKTEELIEKAVERLKDKARMPEIKEVAIVSQTVAVDITDAGVEADRVLLTKKYDTEQFSKLPDILAYLQKETELTRDTLVRILIQSGRLAEFRVNPQAFMSAVSREISRALHELMLSGLQYEKIADYVWEMSRLEPNGEAEITRYLNNLYKVQNKEKSVYDWVEYDSEIERQFAKDLDSNINVKMFIKLPAWFKIDTPIGPYNPDWAFMTEVDEKLYFVRETKSSLDSEDLRVKESQKIQCGQRHFTAIDVDYGVVTSLSEVSF